MCAGQVTYLVGNIGHRAGPLRSGPAGQGLFVAVGRLGQQNPVALVADQRPGSGVEGGELWVPDLGLDVGHEADATGRRRASWKDR